MWHQVCFKESPLCIGYDMFRKIQQHETCHFIYFSHAIFHNYVIEDLGLLGCGALLLGK